ncbi:MAG: hypothetical protein IPJ79_10145 [Bacteroidetes bacterium]|nr:hypothetical protein [Bacteroidota bacterium]
MGIKRNGVKIEEGEDIVWERNYDSPKPIYENNSFSIIHCSNDLKYDYKQMKTSTKNVIKETATRNELMKIIKGINYSNNADYFDKEDMIVQNELSRVSEYLHLYSKTKKELKKGIREISYGISVDKEISKIDTTSGYLDSLLNYDIKNIENHQKFFVFS